MLIWGLRPRAYPNEGAAPESENVAGRSETFRTSDGIAASRRERFFVSLLNHKFLFENFRSQVLEPRQMF